MIFSLHKCSTCASKGVHVLIDEAHCIVIVGLAWAGLVDLAGAWGGVGVFVVLAVFPHYL